MCFLIVNFHYIQEEDKYPYPGIYSTSPERLEAQIKKLGNFFEFIGQKDIIDALERKKSLPEKSCLITFDDGLKSQYENAFPLLKKLKVPAIFFINTLPYTKKKACLVHKVHYNRANLSPDVFRNKILNFIGKEVQLPSFQELRKRYFYSDKKEAELKYLLKEYLTGIQREKIIEKIFQEIVDNEESWCKKYYISKKGLLDLADHSCLGIHSYSHSSLINFSFKEIQEDFRRSIQVINKITGYSLKSVAYPYGQGSLLEAARAAKSVGLKMGFTMERSFNQTLQRPFLFARVDTNDAPGGKSPIFSFKEGELILSNLINKKRYFYFNENEK